MIKKLRQRFIFVSMLSVFLVLAIIMGAINISNYMGAANRADELAAYLLENGGHFPSVSEFLPLTPVGDGFSPEKRFEAPGSQEAVNAPSQSNVRSAPFFGPGSRHGFSYETPFETRFFTVLFSDGSTVSEINLGNIFAVSEEDASSMAQLAVSQGRDRGYIGGYRYLVGEADGGGKMAVFVDNSRELSSAGFFLRSSVLISIIGIIAVFILVLALSRRVISPIAESYEKQKRFITDASHELKTPLTVIDASAEVIALEQGESDWTQSIRAQVKRLTELTSSLVALSRMDENESRLIMTDFSLSDAVSEASEPFSALAASCGLSLQTDIEKNISYNGCERALRSLVSVLLDNAVKYSSENGVITLSLKRQGGKCVLCCKNPSASMKKGSHDELFDRFYRADASRSSETGGFGIGLSLARATVEAHKGKISARSDDGCSLTVTAHL